MIHRTLLVLAVLLGLTFGVGWLRRAFLSDEQLIRAQIERMVEGVCDSRPGKALSGLDRERFVDESSKLDYEDLRAALLYLFLQERLDLETALDPVDGLALELDLDADPPRAVVTYHCPIEEVHSDGTRRSWWDLRGQGVMERRDGDWRFVQSSQVNHGGRRRP